MKRKTDKKTFLAIAILLTIVVGIVVLTKRQQSENSLKTGQAPFVPKTVGFASFHSPVSRDRCAAIEIAQLHSD